MQYNLSSVVVHGFISSKIFASKKANGLKFVAFQLAINNGDGKNTIYANCRAKKQDVADKILSYCKRGTNLIITGTLDNTMFNNTRVLCINIVTFEMLGNSTTEYDMDNPAPETRKKGFYEDNQEEVVDFDSEDLPF